MAKLLKLRRGTTTQHGSFTGAEGEVTVDTSKDTAVVHDGSQAGGRPLAREDLNNVAANTVRDKVNAATDSNTFTDADHTKLNGIETAATADQTAAEIRSLVESASDSNVFTDADHTKLNGIEASATADQTGAEIATALNGQNIYTPGNIGRDTSDYINWTNNTQMDVYVNGSNEFRFTSGGNFHADGDVTAFSTTISSDRKLKENIEVVPDALEKVQALNGVSFDWKKTGEKSAGVIAQEVQGVLPEAVKEVTPVGGGDSHLTVNYHALTSILIEAIKELKAELDEHKGGS